jgi:hypothetical protein
MRTRHTGTLCTRTLRYRSPAEEGVFKIKGIL